MQKRISKHLLSKYSENRCTREEIALVESWYNALAKERKDLSVTMPDLKYTKILLDEVVFAKLNMNIKKRKL